MSKRFIVNQPKAGQGIINAGGAMPGGEEPPYIPTTISFGKGTAARVNAASMGSEEPYVAPVINFAKAKDGKPSKTNVAAPAKATNEEEPYVSTAKLFDKKGGK
ncbi:MAG: hypothetical protein ACYCXJ_07020 [Thermoleophilia bacterium]